MPTPVVPVSIAVHASDPEGNEIDCPLTVRPTKGKNQARASGSPRIRRTGQLLHPVAGRATRSFLEVYATGEQRTVRGAQREGAARFELVARRIIAKPRKLERKQWVVQRPGCLN